MARLFVVTLLLGAMACKGETKTVADPEVAEALKRCNTQLAQAKAANVTSVEDSPILVEIEGDVVTLQPKDQKTVATKAGPTGTADIKERTLALNKAVRNSRGTMQRCYESALKKDSSLQSQPITLQVKIKFNTAGEAVSYSASKKVSADFNSCMERIAKKWSVPAAGSSHVIAATINLSPS